jgi:hypothetical protein
MPLEPLNLPILQQVIPAALLGGQPLFLYQLPHPHRCYTQDLSGLFRSDQAHLTKVVRVAEGSINRNQTAKPPCSMPTTRRLPPMAANSPSPWPTRHRMSCTPRSPGPAGRSSLSHTKSLLLRHEPPPSNWTCPVGFRVESPAASPAGPFPVSAFNFQHFCFYHPPAAFFSRVRVRRSPLHPIRIGLAERARSPVPPLPLDPEEFLAGSRGYHPR